MFRFPLDSLPAPFLALCTVSSLPTSTMRDPAGSGRHKLFSLKPFKLLLLLSKQIFIFYEAEQGCHYNSGFS